MTYRTILAVIRDMDADEPVIAAAGRLASLAGETASGDGPLVRVCAVLTEPTMPVLAPHEIPVQEWRDRVGHLRSQAETIAGRAAKALGDHGIDHDERPVVLPAGMIAEEVAKLARHADLCVMPWPTSLSRRREATEAFDGALFATGRPVLLVPPGPLSKSWGETVMVAWNEQPQAARALFDALPIMRAALGVHVLIVEHDGDPARGPGPDLQAMLARHGVTAKFEIIERRGRSVGEALREHANWLEADMIVMGGYGHSRFREIVLGGATHDMLANNAIPIFLSH